MPMPSDARILFPSGFVALTKTHTVCIRMPRPFMLVGYTASSVGAHLHESEKLLRFRFPLHVESHPSFCYVTEADGLREARNAVSVVMIMAR